MNVKLRSGHLGDIEWLLALQAACRDAPQWSRSVWEDIFRSGTGQAERTVIVADADGAPAGFIVSSSAAGIAEIESIAVDPAMRRRGIGRGLCEAAIQWARERGASEMELEVRNSAGGAQSLYAGLGFTVQGRRRLYYGDPVEDAVLMTLRLAGAE